MPTGNPTACAGPGPAGGVNTPACNTCKYLILEMDTICMCYNAHSVNL